MADRDTGVRRRMGTALAAAAADGKVCAGK